MTFGLHCASSSSLLVGKSQSDSSKRRVLVSSAVVRVEVLASALGLCFFRNSAALRFVKTARPAMVHSRVEPSSMAGVGASSPPRGCAGCGGRIADRFLLFSMERYWHTHCLKCSCCQAQLGDIGTTCYSKGGMVLCRDDYIRLFGHSGACSACGLSIPASEMVMRAQGSVYHLKCFTCATCRNRLVPGDRFHYVNGTIFCEQDRPSGALLSSHLTPLPDQKVC